MDVIDRFLDVPRSMGSDGAVSSPNTPITIDHAVMQTAIHGQNLPCRILVHKDSIFTAIDNGTLAYFCSCRSVCSQIERIGELL